MYRTWILAEIHVPNLVRACLLSSEDTCKNSTVTVKVMDTMNLPDYLLIPLPWEKVNTYYLSTWTHNNQTLDRNLRDLFTFSPLTCQKGGIWDYTKHSLNEYMKNTLSMSN
jgi:hypothetical protein